MFNLKLWTSRILQKIALADKVLHSGAITIQAAAIIHCLGVILDEDLIYQAQRYEMSIVHV